MRARQSRVVETEMDELPSFDRVAFARRFSRLRGGCPQKYWAKRFGLSYAAVKDMEQGRVNPSRAVVLLITAIELSPGFVQDVVRLAQADLLALDGRGRSVIYTAV